MSSSKNWYNCTGGTCMDIVLTVEIALFAILIIQFIILIVWVATSYKQTEKRARKESRSSNRRTNSATNSESASSDTSSSETDTQEVLEIKVVTPSPKRAEPSKVINPRPKEVQPAKVVNSSPAQVQPGKVEQYELKALPRMNFESDNSMISLKPKQEKKREPQAVEKGDNTSDIEKKKSRRRSASRHQEHRSRSKKRESSSRTPSKHRHSSSRHSQSKSRDYKF